MSINFRLFVAGLLLLALVGFIATRVSAATVSGTITHATTYDDGTPLGVNFKQSRVEVGTCTLLGSFNVKEGEALVAPSVTTWSATVARQFGDFCARARTETVSGLFSVYTGTVKVTKVEPNPNPPTFTVGTVAYEYKQTGSGPMLGRNVGTVPLGTQCLSAPLVVTADGEYRQIPLDAVSVAPNTKLKTSTLIALCAA